MSPGRENVMNVAVGAATLLLSAPESRRWRHDPRASECVGLNPWAARASGRP